MSALNERLGKDATLAQKIHDNLKIGVHWDTEVEKQPKWKRCKNGGKWVSEVDSETLKHNVCQVYVSACPVAYTKSTRSKDWEPFASLILKSCYESTLEVANILALKRGKRVKVFFDTSRWRSFWQQKPLDIKSDRKCFKKIRRSSVRCIFGSL